MEPVSGSDDIAGDTPVESSEQQQQKTERKRPARRSTRRNAAGRGAQDETKSTAKSERAPLAGGDSSSPPPGGAKRSVRRSHERKRRADAEKETKTSAPSAPPVEAPVSEPPRDLPASPPPREFIAPMPAARRPASSMEDDFGAGLFENPIRSSPASIERQTFIPIPPPNESGIAATQEPSEPGDQGEPQRGKPRRRRLGRGRGKTGDTASSSHPEAGARTTDRKPAPPTDRDAPRLDDNRRADEAERPPGPPRMRGASHDASQSEEAPSEKTGRRGRRRRRRRGGGRDGGRDGARVEELDSDRQRNRGGGRESVHSLDRGEFDDRSATDFDALESFGDNAGAGRVAAAPRGDLDDDEDVEPIGAEEIELPTAAMSAPGPGRQMLVNVSESEECRIAVLHEKRLEEIFIERQSSLSTVHNVYKARVTNVEPSIQAAFVDFGLPKNGFLHISDVHRKYFPGSDRSNEDMGRKVAKRDRPLIQRCLRRGQELIVQVIKEGVGTKGPTVTTYLSIPGRFLVMMPGMRKLGVSRKIEDEDARRQMRAVLEELTLPDDVGFILRTAGLGQSKRELQRDLNYLTRLWRTITERERQASGPAELYRESDLVIRTMRDVYTSDFSRVIVDDAATARRIRDFLRIAMPRAQHRIELYSDREPMFHRFGIERELAMLHSRRIPLASGGSIVIDTGEAMTTIDVNSGKFRKPDNAEETALRINLEAVDEIARQLRLRDIGGLIVCDFIDMVQMANRRRVVNALREALRSHKERARVLNMSLFGLVEITRQRQRHSITRNMYTQCAVCDASGWVKTSESVALDVIRQIRSLAHQPNTHRIRCYAPTDVAFAVLNRKRGELTRLETETGKSVAIIGNPSLHGEQVTMECEDARGVLINHPQGPAITSGKPGPGGWRERSNAPDREGERDRDRGQDRANDNDVDRSDMLDDVD